MVKYMDLSLKFVLIVLCVTALLYVNSRSERTFSIVVPGEVRDVVEETLVDLQAPKERVPSLNNWIRSASGVTRLDPILLTCLLHTESKFKKNVVSEKGYRGEAQTRRFSDFRLSIFLKGPRHFVINYLYRRATCSKP